MIIYYLIEHSYLIYLLLSNLLKKSSDYKILI